MMETIKKIRELGVSNTIYLFLCFLFTKLLYRSQKIIRFPFEVRGAKYIKFGKNLSTGRYCRIEAYPQQSEKNIVLFFGDNCQINDNVHIVAGQMVEIKNNVLLASRVFISDLNHGSYTGDEQSHPFEIAKDRKLNSKPVFIGNNVWVGEGVVILPGVTIGDNSIIGASSVVSKNVDANSIYVGNPAVKIKLFDFESGRWISIKKDTTHER